MRLVGAGIQEALEQLSVQIAKIIRDVETRLILVVLRQNDAEIVVAHVGGKIITDNAFDTLVGFLIDDCRFQDLDQREGVVIVATVNGHLDRDDIKLDRIAITFWIVPMRQGIETIVDHPQGIAQVLLAVITPRQIGKVRREARRVRREIVLVETNAFDIEVELFGHLDPAPYVSLDRGAP